MFLVLPIVVLVEKKGIRESVGTGLALALVTCFFLVILFETTVVPTMWYVYMLFSSALILFPITKFSAVTFDTKTRPIATGVLLGVDSLSSQLYQ